MDRYVLVLPDGTNDGTILWDGKATLDVEAAFGPGARVVLEADYVGPPRAEPERAPALPASVAQALDALADPAVPNPTTAAALQALAQAILAVSKGDTA